MLLSVILVLAVCFNVAWSQPAWVSPFNGPVNNITGATIPAYGFNALSSYVEGWMLNNPAGFVVYYDTKPAGGSGGFTNMAILGDSAIIMLPSQASVGTVLTSYITRMSNSKGRAAYLFYTPVNSPNQVWLRSGNLETNPLVCIGPVSPEVWDSQGPKLIYTATDGYTIGSISSTVFNDLKYIAISLVSHNEPGPTILLYSSDMSTFTLIGQITAAEDGSAIKVLESFTIFSAASVGNANTEALYIYYVQQGSPLSALRYATLSSVGVGKFQYTVLPATSSLLLANQRGTISAVSPDGTKVILGRVGVDLCNNPSGTTLAQSMFLPAQLSMSAESPANVTFPNGQVSYVQPLSMPTYVNDRCAGQALPSSQSVLMWLDRSSSLMMQGVANWW